MGILASLVALILLWRFQLVFSDLQQRGIGHALLTETSTAPAMASAAGEAEEGQYQSFTDVEVGGVAPESGSAEGGTLPTARPPAERTSQTLLAPSLYKFEDLLPLAQQKNGLIVELPRDQVIEALDCYAEVLNKIGGGMGWHITLNTKKMRKSKTDKSKDNFHEWILTELPTHEKVKQGWQDDSAWMSNRWIGYMLDFFVEFFEELSAGQDSKAALDASYQRTLVKHHTFLMRKAFGAATSVIPNREKLMNILQGPSGSAEDLQNDIVRFVKVIKPFLRFLIQTEKDCERLLEEHRRNKAP